MIDLGWHYLDKNIEKELLYQGRLGQSVLESIIDKVVQNVGLPEAEVIQILFE
jgi:hypothetical protein